MNRVIFLRSLFFSLVIFSLFVIFHTKITNDDFTIFTNPEGPNTEDYFLLEETDAYEGDS